ncbi:MAG: alpha/beta fold hydrolase [Terriglobales bacterium]
MKKGAATMLFLSTAILSATTSAYSLPSVSATGAQPSSQNVEGMKQIHEPQEAAETAPSLEWVDPSVSPRVVLLCIHGLGLHKGNYDAFGKNICKYGIPTYAIDVRGFGEYLESGRHTQLDFDGTLADIKLYLQKLHEKYPDLPVVILGESMGGAIALRATALYPELISGLVSSVPSGDRFNQFGQNLSVGMHVLVGGFHKPMNIGDTIVKQATKKEDLRKEWSTDPMGKMEISPAELMRFSGFMAENFDAAKKITDKPVLFVQGVSDKLVRPAGTWKLCDSLATPNREMVLSKTGEHLIFEEAQFSDNDLLFLRRWIDRNIVKLDKFAVTPAGGAAGVETADVPATNSTDTTASSQSGDTAAAAGSSTTDATNTAATGAATASASTQTGTSAGTASASTITTAMATTPATITGVSLPLSSQSSTQAESTPQGISYWIELYRNGKLYRCNNKTHFQSGDAIRFHVTPHSDGYAYVVMKEGSSGKSSILFPTPQTGSNNFLRLGQDYPLPYQTWLQFDKNPGIEKVSLVFSRARINPESPMNNNRILTAYVSPERTGSKDLVPTRMKLSWDDPAPVIIPETQQSAVASSGNNSIVRVSYSGDEDVMAIDVALAHD